MRKLVIAAAALGVVVGVVMLYRCMHRPTVGVPSAPVVIVAPVVAQKALGVEPPAAEPAPAVSGSPVYRRLPPPPAARRPARSRIVAIRAPRPAARVAIWHRGLTR